MARSRRYVKRKYQKKYTKRFRRQTHTDAIILGGLLIAALASSIFFGNTFLSQDLVVGMTTILVVIFVLVIVGVVISFRIRKKKRDAFLRAERTLTELRAMDPFDFEQYIGFLFTQQGFKTYVTQGQGDHGIDVVFQSNGKRVAVQVKRYAESNVVGEPALREFYGSYADDFDAGMYVTTSSFTQQAQAWAKERNMTLVDGHMLMTMIQKMYHA